MVIAVLTACGDDSRALQQAKFAEVMAIHDEVMPYMGTIRNLQKDIQAKIANIKFDTTGVGQEQSMFQIGELDRANEAMMDWMRNFAQPSDERSHEDIMNYYIQEFDKIGAVKQQMLDAINMSTPLPE